jgi:hypothetical protein
MRLIHPKTTSPILYLTAPGLSTRVLANGEVVNVPIIKHHGYKTINKFLKWPEIYL